MATKRGSMPGVAARTASSPTFSAVAIASVSRS